MQSTTYAQYSCDEASYEIAGFENIKQNQIVEYTIMAAQEQEIALEKAITFRLFKSSSLIERVK
ncbi:hypothetical protein KKG31_01445 [Patescibacteria group bacterium]|nr:hypothetical protein [Patescibacteria group bacterium]MBU1757842.1 hypothetical protein [Patescibacteria group bacterium]